MGKVKEGERRTKRELQSRSPMSLQGREEALHALSVQGGRGAGSLGFFSWENRKQKQSVGA